MRETGSTFLVLTVQVKTPEEERIAHLKVQAIPQCARATHLISVYVFANGFHSRNDNGDFGLGRYLYMTMNRKNLRNRIIFLSRDFGGVHLGQKWFDIVRDLVNKVLGKECKQAGDLFQTLSSTPNPLAKPQPPASQLCILASSDTISFAESAFTNDDTVSGSLEENTLVQEDVTQEDGESEGKNV